MECSTDEEGITEATIREFKLRGEGQKGGDKSD